MTTEYAAGTIGVIWDKAMDEIWLYQRTASPNGRSRDSWKEHCKLSPLNEVHKRLRSVMSLEQNPGLNTQAFYYTPEEFEAITGMRL